MHQCLIGLDPASFRNLGFATVTYAESNGILKELEIKTGTIVLDKVIEPWQALWPIFHFTDSFIGNISANMMIVEKTSSFSGGFVTGQVSNCIGSILAACGKNNLPVQFVYPTHVKKVITGKGKATKIEMRRSVIKFVEKYTGKKIKFDSEHSCDALSNILCWMIDKQILENPNA